MATGTDVAGVEGRESRVEGRMDIPLKMWSMEWRYGNGTEGIKSCIEIEQAWLLVERLAAEKRIVEIRLKPYGEPSQPSPLEKFKEAVRLEPEFPGEMPQAMWVDFLGFARDNDRAAFEFFCRAIVRATKEGILQRMEASREAPVGCKPTARSEGASS